MRNKTLELIHAKIHGLRMIPRYKPSKFEHELNVIICEEYQNDCVECKNKLKAIKLKEELKELEPQEEKKGFLGEIEKIFK